jgi:hypothetical protein
MRVSPLLILQDHDRPRCGDAVAALVGDGRRVLVTAATRRASWPRSRAALRPTSPTAASTSCPTSPP